MKNRQLLKQAVLSVLDESRVVLSTTEVVEGVKSLLIADPDSGLVLEVLRDLESDGVLESYWGGRGAPLSQRSGSLF